VGLLGVAKDYGQCAGQCIRECFELKWGEHRQRGSLKMMQCRSRSWQLTFAVHITFTSTNKLRSGGSEISITSEVSWSQNSDGVMWTILSDRLMQSERNLANLAISWCLKDLHTHCHDSVKSDYHFHFLSFS